MNELGEAPYGTSGGGRGYRDRSLRKDGRGRKGSSYRWEVTQVSCWLLGAEECAQNCRGLCGGRDKSLSLAKLGS